jgi:guanylate kinase
MPDCVTIFILPPSRTALQQRLQERRTDSAEVIARRLADAVTDMSHYREFDFVVVNDRFDQAVIDLGAILDGHGDALRPDRATLQPLVGQLLQ